jgi:hypothetical protein
LSDLTFALKSSIKIRMSWFEVVPVSSCGLLYRESLYSSVTSYVSA